MGERLKKILNITWVRHMLFWLVVFSFYTTKERLYYDSVADLLWSNFFEVLSQCLFASVIIFWIAPRYQKHGKVWETVLLLFALLLFINLLYIFESVYILGLRATCCYSIFKENFGHLPFWEQVWLYKKNFFIMGWNYLQPLFFLVAFEFYVKQQKIAELNEQKKIAELNALKTQLNPHFLFNTLNSLYALALKKSDQTAIVIEKLADILDYIIYRSDENFVPLAKEIELLENYIALEKVRYGSRVNVVFDYSQLAVPTQIAPLILLTFVENAFTHGVSQEINKASIFIQLTTDKNGLSFELKNSKAATEVSTDNTDSLGLKNIKKQLELLYPNSYSLQIDDAQESFQVLLKLPLK